MPLQQNQRFLWRMPLEKPVSVREDKAYGSHSKRAEVYEKALKENGFEILLKESDQERHLVWIARKKF